MKVTEPKPGGGEYSTLYEYTALGALHTVSMTRDGQKNGVPGQYTQTRTFVYNSDGSLYQTIFPETGTTTYTYGNGVLSTQTDTFGRMRKWIYTSGRLSQIERYYAGVERTSERTVFTYDAYGRLQNVEYGTQRLGRMSEAYEYYPSGQLKSKSLLPFWGEIKADFTYDTEGRLYSTKYPQGDTLYLKYNEADLPKELWKTEAAPAPDSLQAGVGYNWLGQMNAMSRPDGWGQSWAFNEGGLMTSHTINAAFNNVSSVSYAYETAAPVTGKLQTSTQSFNTQPANTVTYGYDTLGRLTSASSAAWNQSYTYDGFGNLQQKTGSTGTVNWGINSENNGGLSGGGVEYDADNRLLYSSWTKYYMYDSANQRVIEFADGEDSDTYVLTLRVGGIMLGRYTYDVNNTGTLTTWQEFRYLGGRRIDIGSDRLGSDLTGGRVLLPYGEELSPTANGKTKFATYWRDADSGMDYADQRYYSPGTGRFLSADPYIGSAGPEYPSSWNRYAYVEGDPINSNDPTGLLTILIPGSFSSCGSPDFQRGSGFWNEVRNTFGEDPVCFEWDNQSIPFPSVFEAAANKLDSFIDDSIRPGEPLNIVAHSNGGNVAKYYTQRPDAHYVDNLVTLGTPQIAGVSVDCQKVGNYVNVYSSSDSVQPMQIVDAYYAVMWVPYVAWDLSGVRLRWLSIYYIVGIWQARAGRTDASAVNVGFSGYSHAGLHSAQAWRETISWLNRAGYSLGQPNSIGGACR